MSSVAAGFRVERALAIPISIPMAGRPPYQASLLVLESVGLTGRGEAPAPPGRGLPAEALHRALEAATGALVEGREGGSWPAPVRAAVETAMLDLAGRRMGVPVAGLLGGARRDEVACNLLVGATAPARVAETVEAGAIEGFRVFKLKSAGGPLRLDLERLGAARWAAGHFRALRIDLSGAFPAEAAETRLRALARLRLELIEQPLPAGAQFPAWQRLAGVAAVLAVDESLADPVLGQALGAAGFGLAIKLGTVGGPAAARDLARGATGPVLLSSSYETSIGIAAALHTACALDAEPLACGLATRRLLAGDVASGLAPCGPRLALPDGPGLGVELDSRALGRYRRDS